MVADAFYACRLKQIISKIGFIIGARHLLYEDTQDAHAHIGVHCLFSGFESQWFCKSTVKVFVCSYFLIIAPVVLQEFMESGGMGEQLVDGDTGFSNW